MSTRAAVETVISEGAAMSESRVAMRDDPTDPSTGNRIAAPVDLATSSVPMVVIQYRHNPSLVMVLLICLILLAIGGYGYHRLALERVHRQVAEAARAQIQASASPRIDDRPAQDNRNLLTTGADHHGKRPDGALIPSAVEIPHPLALNAQPTPVPSRTQPTGAATAPAVDTTPPKQSPQIASAKVDPRSDNSTTRAMNAAPETKSGVSKIPAAARLASIATGKTTPTDEPDVTSRPVKSGQEPIGQPTGLEVKPLPSKEDSLRAIQAEAARKQDAIVEGNRNQLAELQSVREETRTRFREELREILSEQGNRAGSAIDQLSDKYREFVPPILHSRASKIWSSSGRSMDRRIQLIRQLDLPESLILDFMSDDLNEHLRARNGPKSKNEVRVRAAMLLLKHDPDTTSTPTAGTQQSAQRNPARASVISTPGVKSDPFAATPR